ncbi:MAG: PLP-dependent lyase/thiolase [Nanoarchaeota archaeon]|nr:PLP-dependent lyase/thiolase [Nanoarchaeota archaeon]
MVLTEKERKILYSIRVASENDPTKPEFPPDNPKFPATPTRRITLPGFSNVWLKDESYNPTGTHKDRMAWEIVVTYRDFLLAKKNGQTKFVLPAMSIISSGSAAIAIQTLLKKYGLPHLKVLTDYGTNRKIIESMKKIGCEIFETDLSRKPFHWKEILTLTHNPDGFDITSSEALDPTTRFYDWLSYEILNSSPDYCFIPFGTGNLFENVLNVNKKEASTQHHDPRFKGNLNILKRCNFMGATTNNLKSKADKLYSPHLPFVHYDEQWIKLYKYAGFCGVESNVYLVKEVYLDQAIKIAEDQKINCEPSGIAGLALLLQMKHKIPQNKKILIVNTGKTKYP